MIKVLFTGGGGAGNEALWRLLGNRYEMHFGDSDPNAIDPSIPKENRHKLPRASNNDYLEKVSMLCQSLGIDLLVPGVDEELLKLASNVGGLGLTRLLLPHVDYVESMLDKLHMIRALSEKGLPVPLSQKLDEECNQIRYPCICKPRRGRGSRDVRVLNSVAEARALNSAMGSAAAGMLLQNKIEGVEYTVQMIADAKGHLRAIVPVRVEMKRGITIRAETEAEPRVIKACSAIHQAIPTGGCYNVQLILSKDGEVLPFEINPRISTTFCLVVAAGIDPIAIFLGQEREGDILPFISGVKLRRHWRNVIFSE
jgi:carbamoyl-phosphate synthase large subunit